jgi:hypothetical protein
MKEPLLRLMKPSLKIHALLPCSRIWLVGFAAAASPQGFRSRNIRTALHGQGCCVWGRHHPTPPVKKVTLILA